MNLQRIWKSPHRDNVLRTTGIACLVGFIMMEVGIFAGQHKALKEQAANADIDVGPLTLHGSPEEAAELHDENRNTRRLYDQVKRLRAMLLENLGEQEAADLQERMDAIEEVLGDSG